MQYCDKLEEARNHLREAAIELGDLAVAERYDWDDLDKKYQDVVLEALQATMLAKRLLTW
jgi:hypothetical protein